MKNNPINALGSFFVGVREEAKKVTWPTRTQTTQTTIIVITATLIVAAYIGLVDYGLSALVQKFLIK